MLGKKVVVITFLFLLSFPLKVLAQDVLLEEQTSLDNQMVGVEFKEEMLEGRVVGILEEKQIIPAGAKETQIYQKLEVLVTKGSLKGKRIVVESGDLPVSGLQKYKVGDELVISYSKNVEGKDVFYITDYVRRKALFLVFLIFVFVVVLIGRLQGVTSLFVMAFSFLVILKFILPEISKGKDPVQTAIFGSLMIIPVTFVLSHGFNKKTAVAVVGTLISIVFTGFLTGIFVEFAKLTGFASEEAGFLQAYKGSLINIKGLLLAGIIIGVFGVLDDVTISQSAIVEQLKTANPKLKPGELYSKAMAVGKDHIASMVNTLVLVYTGASLPLLILFVDSSRSFLEIVNLEVVAEEVVRTLVGSIGLVLAVPITTLIASLVFSVRGEEKRC